MKKTNKSSKSISKSSNKKNNIRDISRGTINNCKELRRSLIWPVRDF
jgi:hypothetical protein